MTSVIVKEKVKSAQIDAVIVRADGTREDLGTIAFYHKNPFKRLLHRISK